MFALFRRGSAVCFPFRVGLLLGCAAVWFGLASLPVFAQPLLNVSFVDSDQAAQFAAAKVSSNDVWNLGTLPQPNAAATSLSTLKWADGSDSPVSITISNQVLVVRNETGVLEIFTPRYPQTLFAVSQLPSGLYRIYLYGHYVSGVGEATLAITSGGINFGSKPPSVNPSSNSIEKGSGMAVFASLEIGPSQNVNIYVSSGPPDGSQFVLDGLQIQMTGASSNDPKFYSSVFTSIERFPNGDVRMRLVGPLGAVVGIESSTNLLEWVRLTTVTNTGANANFSDPGGNKAPSRFFRVVPP